jgi:glycosyltransferase involved in cell wall biosynthesis
MSRPQISVVIPVRNEGTRLTATLRSIAYGRSCLFPLEIVVVDDASEDGCCDHLGDLFDKTDLVSLRVIRLDRWSGIPYARNRGAFAAAAEILFITDGNVRFPRHWDVPIRQRLRPGIVICATIADLASSFRGYGCTLHLSSMSVNWLRTPLAFGGYVPVAPCTGTVIYANLFRSLGGYDTAMPIYGAAEPEFSIRLWLSGAEIVVAPELVISHRFRPPSERRPFLQKILEIQIRNYLRFAQLYLNERDLVDVIRHYAIREQEITQSSLQALEQGDVWRRRSELQSVLPYKFDWLVRRFGLKTSCKLRFA